MNQPQTPTMIDGSEDLLTQAALAMLGNGFGDEYGTMESSDGWNGLAYVSGPVLDNIGEHDLAARFRAMFPFRSPACQVWVRTIDTGATYLRTSAWDASPDADRLIRTWDRLAGEHADQEARTLGAID